MKKLLLGISILALGSQLHAMEKNLTKAEQSFIDAAQKGEINKLQQLFAEHKIDVNAVDQLGSTALILASGKGNLDVVKFLLKNDAKINIADHFGRTALIEASKKGRLDVVKFLLKNGADINISARGTATALYYAMEFKYPEVEKYLRAKGARPSEVERVIQRK